MAEAVKLYHIISTARDVRTRTVRAQNATHSGLKQFIGGTYRLIRKRPLVLPQSEIEKYIEELKQKQAVGMLEVRTPDGRLVDLDTLEVSAAAVSTPRPHPPKDSIANDESWGESAESVPAGKPLQQAMKELDERAAAREQEAASDGSDDEEVGEDEAEIEEVADGTKRVVPKAQRRRRRNIKGK